MKFALVRREPSEVMKSASLGAVWGGAPAADDPDGSKAFNGEIFKMMLSASEEPTPEELDGLCAAYVPDEAQWQRVPGSDRWLHPRLESVRKDDRARMRAFLRVLSS